LTPALALILSRVPRDRHEELREWFDERAGIREYDGLQPRAVAEAEALAELAKKVEDRKWEVNQLIHLSFWTKQVGRK
jgi:hypothetical protein